MKIEDLYKIMVEFKQDFLSFRHEMNEFRKETKDELNKHSQTLIGIENTLNFYGDMYKMKPCGLPSALASFARFAPKINKDGIHTLDKRVTILESI